MTEDHVGTTRLISLQVPYETLQKDLETFKQKALDLGASLAEIIPAQLVEIDERVRLKCFIPLCPYYDKNPYCPPRAPQPEFMRAALSRYSWAILFALDVVPVEQFADCSVQRKLGVQWTKKSIEIAGRVETLAFASGYYLAMGLCQFNCLRALCDQEHCLVLEGDKCPFSLVARPSMEGLGIDVFRLVTKVGWDIYPIYRSIDPKLVPRALAVGIVFIY
jgi:predicted metal-binding protein